MSQQQRLSLVLVLNLAMITGLVTVGLTSHSLGVLAAGGDYAADSAAILLGIIAIQFSTHGSGHPKVTTYVALINAAALLIVSIVVISDGIGRLATATPHIQGLPVVIISLLATVSMGIGALILSRDAAGSDLHMRSVLLDTLSDAVSSAAVAVSGVIIVVTGQLYWLDSGLAVLIGVAIGYGAVKLLRDVITTLRSK